MYTVVQADEWSIGGLTSFDTKEEAERFAKEQNEECEDMYTYFYVIKKGE